MKKYKLISSSRIKFLAREAKRLKRSEGISHVMALNIMADKEDFKSWREMAVANDIFNTYCEKLRSSCILFFDNPDAPNTTDIVDLVPEGGALEACTEILSSRAEASKVFKELRPYRDSYRYTSDITSATNIYESISEQCFHWPLEVVFRGYYLPFEMLENLDESTEGLEFIEKAWIEKWEEDDYLQGLEGTVYRFIEKRFRPTNKNAIFDFTGKLDFSNSFEYSFYDEPEGDLRNVSKTMIDMIIDCVLLIGATQDDVKEIKQRTGVSAVYRLSA
jgi:hypothetical protein